MNLFNIYLVLNCLNGVIIFLNIVLILGGFFMFVLFRVFFMFRLSFVSVIWKCLEVDCVNLFFFLIFRIYFLVMLFKGFLL